MRAVLRATALLSGSSLVAILTGVVGAKARAVLLGPDGMALSVLLQTTLNLSVLAAALGIGTGVVRIVAAALAAEDQATVAACLRAAWALRWTLAGVAVISLVLCRSAISRLFLGSDQHSSTLVIIAAAVGFALVTDMQRSVLNAYHRIEALAKLGLITAVLGTASAITVIAMLGWAGIAAAILVTTVIGCATSTYLLRTRVPHPTTRTSLAEMQAAAGSLMTFGTPYTASALIGTGVQMALPIMVLHVLNSSSVAYYQAAATIAVGYLGFLTSAMGQDYYPRVSAARLEPDRLSVMVNDQQRVVLILTVPLILVLIGVAPYIVPIAYTSAFRPAIAVLQWQLLGDLFKFSSWTLSFVLLARSGTQTFFLVELVGGSLLLTASWLGAILWGLVGIGIGWLVAYVGYFILTLIVVRREIGLRWTSQNKQMMVQALIGVLLVSLAALAGNEALRLAVTASCATVISITSLRALRNDIGIDITANKVVSMLGRWCAVPRRT